MGHKEHAQKAANKVASDELSTKLRDSNNAFMKKMGGIVQFSDGRLLWRFIAADVTNMRRSCPIGHKTCINYTRGRHESQKVVLLRTSSLNNERSCFY